MDTSYRESSLSATPQKTSACSWDSSSRVSYIHRWIVSLCVLCGSPLWPSPPVVGPLGGPPLCVGPLWVGSPSCRLLVLCGIYSRAVSRSCTRSCIDRSRSRRRYSYIYGHIFPREFLERNAAEDVRLQLGFVVEGEIYKERYRIDM